MSLSLYDSDMRELILIVFGTNVTDEAGNEKVLYFPTSPRNTKITFFIQILALPDFKQSLT